MGCGTSPKAPKARDYYGEMSKTLDAQTRLAPQQLKAYQQYAPQYAQAQLDVAQGTMPGIMDLSRQYAQTPIMDTLQQQAQGDLALGGQLGPDEQRLVEQQTRAAFNDRGLGISNPAMFAEIMNLYGARQGRQRERQNFAMGVDQQNFGRFQQGYGAATGLMGYGAGLGGFDPQSGYAQDLYNTNYNAQAASNIAGANNRAAMFGSGMQLLGSGSTALGSIGAAAMMCWVAREVYGADNPDWKRFRKWLYERAPWWFFRLYARHGEAFAAWLSGKKRIKALIRRWMDGRIGTMAKGVDRGV
jgi:hypothetical protein